MKNQIYMEFYKKLKEIVEPICEKYSYELVDLEYRREPHGWVLRVYIDKVGGVTVEDCAYLSEKISKELDIKDPIPHSYILEVSSPGLDRPLKRKRDFERHMGEKVNITLLEEIEGKKKFEGKIFKVDESSVTLKIDDSFVTIPLEKIKKAMLIVEF
ncbi:ribosome maturation factor RimP [Dictyoglomus thermophilum]|uniref:Ribosome maturation factor RimP n=1 Tax=Dictyoglomus thermophilum (strain ATCC 35947 / DSM 3960 / H-6-12) TaxID=309799 RepID=RIMP_DICT6|nr:ribosome maturation factor RimP [Dictyoglomus thermophilum]B5YEH1.1 RecName: Full=Ribosome maturation factor RimP [Dictyoglomus thermophilum H-6-12]ACI18976.1 YlxS [Dictyoglomus thermophilum H-6-12]MCX7721076.1 ribosome maturation factor RimP [Dictyoglomus thermophilum]